MTSVVVGICTFRRNEQLAVLLDAIAALRSQHQPAVELDVVVVDDDPAGGAEAVVRTRAETFSGRMLYRHAGSANLSVARNTVIEQGCRLSDWLAFIDDDCLPGPGWLGHLLEVQQRTDADIVTGHVVYRVSPGAPAWLLDEPFCNFTAYEDGEEPAYGTTANVLLRTEFLRSSGVRFRSTLGQTGGEDMTFYDDARAHGASMRYAAEALVYEELTASREGLRYHLHRQFWLGNNMVVINRHTHRESMARLFVRGVKRIGVALTQPAVRTRRGERPQVRWAAAYALQGLGLVLGVLGVTVRHRA